MFLSNQTISKWASNRKTSFEIAEAILEMSSDFEQAHRIWESPSRYEIRTVMDKATQHGIIDPNCLFWGFSSLTTICREQGIEIAIS